LCEECYDFRRKTPVFQNAAPSHTDSHDWNVVEVKKKKETNTNEPNKQTRMKQTNIKHE